MNIHIFLFCRTNFFSNQLSLRLISKEIRRAEHEYMNIQPHPPPPNQRSSFALEKTANLTGIKIANNLGYYLSFKYTNSYYANNIYRYIFNMLNRIFLKIPPNILLKYSLQFSQISYENNKQKRYSGVFNVTIM